MSLEIVIVCPHPRPLPDDFISHLKKNFAEASLVLNRTEIRSDAHYYFTSIDPVHLRAFQLSMLDLSKIYSIDVACIPGPIFKAKKGLVVFDMDSTLITSEVINELAMRQGVGDEVKVITARAMNGEMGFDQSLTERVALLKGFHRRHMEDILKNLCFTPGVPEFVKALQARGIKTAIASGGFDYFAQSLKTQLKMDYVFANDLEFEGDLLTGRVAGAVVNAEAKEKILIELAQKENLELNQVVAIGDGANDIPMLLKAGLGVAIHAKETVQKTAHFRINYGPMTHILSLMNYEAL